MEIQALLGQVQWLLIAKGILVFIMITFSFMALYVAANARAWHLTLSQTEDVCNQLRDMSMFQGTVLRAQLSEFAERLRKGEPRQDPEFAKTLLKTLSPVAMLLLSKERSLLKWSFTALAAGQNLFSLWKRKKS